MKPAYIIFIFLTTLLWISCGNNESNTTKSEADNTLADTVSYNKYLQRGKEAAMQTGDILIKNLTGAINEHGTVYAIQFCNTRAIPLTDSMATQHKTIIKRVTDKPRNPNNKANAEELQYIQQLKSLLASGQKPQPQLHEKKDTIVGYYPIVTNTMCMQCHGDKQSIASSTLSALNKLYPSDAAIGYQPEELRGLWVIEMIKN
ncbi:MAG: DUF3365 domain-containing protein [Niabella sp.]